MMRPSTASPRNSRRSLESWPGFSAHQERCTRAGARTSGLDRWTPRRSASSSSLGTGSGMVVPSEPGEDVVHGVTHCLDVLEVFVLDAEPHAPFAQLLLERLGQLDEGQRIGVEVVGEGVSFVDGRRLDLEDVGEAVTDQVDNLVFARGTCT